MTFRSIDSVGGSQPAAGRVRGERLRGFVRRFRRNPTGVAGLIIAIIVALLTLLAPLIAPYDPLEADFSALRSAPSAEHWLGTDEVGRDVLSRVLYGGRISLLVSLGAVVVGFAFGVTVGLVSGFFAGSIDLVAMRFIDALIAIPGLILAIVLATALGPSLRNLVIAIGVAAIPGFARLARGEVLRVRQLDYVLAARTLGADTRRTLSGHVFPNITAPLIVQVSLRLAGAILTEAALGFLGVGIPPPTATWGSLANAGRPFLEQAPWIVFSGGFAIALAVLGFSLLGDGLRDTLDPRLRT